MTVSAINPTSIKLLSTHLDDNHGEQHPHGWIHKLPQQHHRTPDQLQHHIQQHKGVRQELATAPRETDIVLLFGPLEPHTQAILQEGGYEAEAGDVGEVVLGVAEDPVGKVVCLRQYFVVRTVGHLAHWIGGEGEEEEEGEGEGRGGSLGM